MDTGAVLQDVVEERLHLGDALTHWSITSSIGVCPVRRCREMSRQASSVTPCWKLPPFPSHPKTSNGSPSPSDGDGHVQVAELGLELA